MEKLYLSKKKTIYGEALHVIVENTLAFQIGEFGFLDLALWWPMGLFPSYFLHQPNYYLKEKKKKPPASIRSSWNKQKWIMYYFRCMSDRLAIHLRFHLIMIYKYDNLTVFHS